ncbi:DoxX family membrane protein [Salinirubellus salinus]|uniref:DoxX family membrane protein n=1 Tax=Salinirubellus salinus TaxID=1364945 RepID=A0A9E7R003_9EURY|nr:DoxX family membrane protein [Salinirubellus salinus]UWM53166.1 DoxX family membrane protein [Salinirubellus salinus]
MGDSPGPLARLRSPLRYAMGLTYVVAGVLHFVVPDAYERVVPPQLPAKRTLVYLTGVMEAGFGLGVLFERTRRVSAWGLVVTLLAVFPANVYMAVGDPDLSGAPEFLREAPDAALWARLPLQAVLIAWAWWYTGEDED